MKKIAQVKIGISRLSAGGKTLIGKKVVGCMRNNPHFANLIPSLAIIETATNELSKALKALDGSFLNTAIKNEKEATLNLLISLLASYVQSTSGGDRAKILSSGIDVRNAATRVGLLDAVGGLTIKTGLRIGSVDLKWKGNRKSKMNVVQMCTDLGLAQWVNAGETTKAKITIDSLQSGQTYYFRVACRATAGLGAWSTVISCRVY